MASTYLQRTISSAGNQKKWTFSAWFKKASIGVDGGVFSFTEDSNNYFRIRFRSSDKLQVDNNYGGSSTMSLILSRVQRDINAYYHLVVAYDSAQGTASDRVKIYINGTQETALDTSSYPSQNTNTRLGNTGSNIELGRSISNQYFNGIFSHVHYCDGYAYAASDFGSTDSTTGQWKINTSPSVSYGTNGFFWLKDSIATTDHSPNSNTFTVGGGTLTKTEDCPSNLMNVWNPLNMTNSNMTFSNGNTKLSSSVAWLGQVGSLAMPSGKYYWEIKYGSGNVGYGVGTWGKDSTNTNDLSNSNYGYVGKYEGGYELFQNGGQPHKINNSSNDGNYGSQASSGDIIMVAYDADNNKLFTGINGTWNNSSNPANGTSPMYTTTSGELYTPSCSIENGTLETNFGNGYFGTTAVATNSGNGYAGAEGKSIFNYQPPTGYSALSTKGLNQ